MTQQTLNIVAAAVGAAAGLTTMSHLPLNTTAATVAVVFLIVWLGRSHHPVQ